MKKLLCLILIAATLHALAQVTTNAPPKPDCLECVVVVMFFCAFCELYEGDFGDPNFVTCPKDVVDNQMIKPVHVPPMPLLRGYMPTWDISAMGQTDCKGDAVLTHSEFALQSSDTPTNFTTLYQVFEWKTANGMTTVVRDPSGVPIFTNYVPRVNGMLTNQPWGLLDFSKPAQFYRTGAL